MLTPAGGDKDEERLAAQVRALDPTARALLDLTLRRGFSDEEIGDLLGVSAQQAGDQREDALDRLARGLGAKGAAERDQIADDLKRVGDDAWLVSNAGQAAATETASPPADEATAAAPVASEEIAETGSDQPDEWNEPWSPDDEGWFGGEGGEKVRTHEDSRAAIAGPIEDAPESEKPGGRLPPAWLAPLIGLIALGLVIWVVLGGNDSSTPRSGSSPTVATGPEKTSTDTTSAPPSPAPPPKNKPKPPAKPTPQPQPKPHPKPKPPAPQAAATAAAVPGVDTPGKVSATSDGKTLRVQLAGLPDPGAGAYTVWLYDSLIDSRRLGALARGDGTITVPIPADAGSFPFLDVSRESSLGDATHSGQSLFRQALPPLLG